MNERMQQTVMFTVELDENQIAIVKINAQNQSTNWLGEEFVKELRSVIGTILYQQAKGVVFISSHPQCFIKGFDLDVFTQKTDAQLLQFVQDVQAVMREINQLKVLVVSAINGDCFGLGLELAISCDYRFASDNEMTLFAMPQVRSGILPFAGGTQRLPRLVGLSNALPLLLSGYKIGAKKALKIGLVDQLVPENQLLQHATRFILSNSKNKIVPSATLTSKIKQQCQHWVENNQFIRNKYLESIENKVWLKAFGNYPAVNHIITLLKTRNFKSGLLLEQEMLIKLYRTKEAQVLNNLKRTMRTMKTQYHQLAQVKDIKHLTVLGCGYMGAGIAYIAARQAQIPVRIKETQSSQIQKGLRFCYELMQKEVDKGKISSGKMLQMMNLITAGERLIREKSSDFIIEAVNENLQLKQQLLQECEQYFADDAIFATNTSTLSIKAIASVAKRPENVIGLHYFSPVANQKMVEIVPHVLSSEQTIATAIHFVIQQGKIPLIVSDRQGFFINRILTPYLLEAIQCIIDGEAIEFIDRSLQEFGFPIGPLEMIDQIGLDIIVKSNPALVAELGNRFALPEQVDLLVRNDRKGIKNRRGFYLYDTYGERRDVDKSIYYVMETITRNNLDAEEIVRRCILRMLNEACWCLQDEVIRSQEEGNVASVLAIHFPEFRGGIYAYIESIGAVELVRQLNKHAQLYGNRFMPCDWLLEKAQL